MAVAWQWDRLPLDDALSVYRASGMLCAPCVADLHGVVPEVDDGPLAFLRETRSREEAEVLLRVYFRYSASLGADDTHARRHRAHGHAGHLYVHDLDEPRRSRP